MAKRGYKLQEYVAHSADVNCLNIGKKTCRMFVTGGDDHKVNLWSIGKPTSLMSLCGHTSPVEAVAFDSAEVLVLAGASTGAIKLWDLEEVKMVRTLTGHRSNCTAVEFHPFGEFFASGSADTNLRIWDIRNKGCIHTYRGHTRGISTIRFTPDGRWVVSGGYDNVVKIWDLTAGKLLHEFKFHEGHIRSLDFHPLEFLLATGSADNTVKFWDLETFELIGSTRPEATGVRAMTFHPDGRTLFCGLDDSLKVYAWEPVICHDTVDVGWSTLGDLCIREGKLLGCSFYQDSVAVWVADTSHIKPYGVGFVPEESDSTKKNFNSIKSDSPENVRSGRRMSPDDEIKEIKNIYIDSAGANLVSSQKVGSFRSPKTVLPFDLKEINHPSAEKKNPTKEADANCGKEALDKTSVTPTFTPKDIHTEVSSNSEKERVTFSRTKPGMLLRPAHVQKPSNSKSDIEKLAAALASETLEKMLSEKESVTDTKPEIRNISEDGIQESGEAKSSNIKNVTKKFDTKLPPQATCIQENCDKSGNESRGNATVKIINGVAVVSGRTRSLVERFERREKFSSEDQSIDNKASQTVVEVNNRPTTPTTITPPVAPEADRKPPPAPSTTPVVPEIDRLPPVATAPTPQSVAPVRKPPAIPVINTRSSISEVPTPRTMPVSDRTPPIAEVPTPRAMPVSDRTPSILEVPIPQVMPVSDRTPSIAEVPTPRVLPVSDRTPSIPEVPTPRVMPESDRIPSVPEVPTPQDMLASDRTPSVATVASPRDVPETMATVPKMRYRGTPLTDRRHVPTTNFTPRVMARADRSPPTATNMIRRVRSPPSAVNVTARVRSPPQATNESRRISLPPTSSNMTTRVVREVRVTPSSLEEPQISGRELNASVDIGEDIMQNHDAFLSSLKSRLTKLQVVRHFWERGDIKGALNALRKLPDHSVQADVISVLVEKLEIFTLDLFSCLLPVLVGLLDSKMERHTNIALEMLLKLVAVFGSVVSSTVSAPRVVGVDLHAEERLECCKQCFSQLQNVKQTLPALIKRGGLVAKSAMELNLVLQDL